MCQSGGGGGGGGGSARACACVYYDRLMWGLKNEWHIISMPYGELCINLLLTMKVGTMHLMF